MKIESNNYRYPGVQPFSEHQHQIFFGRSEDIDSLTSIIILEKLTILFGKSGYGKSSIINAGVIPEILKQNLKRKNKFYPYLIRFQPYSREEGKSLVEKFIFNLSIRDQEKGVILQSRDFLPKSIWGELKRRQTNSTDCFVLLFDQFEEIFTYPIIEQKEFISQIADLLYSDVSEYLEREEERHSRDEVEFMIQRMDCRIVFTIRSDRISELDNFKNDIPSILNKRYELKALRPNQAKEALLEPSKLDFLTYDKDSNINFITPKFNWFPEALEAAVNQLLSEKSKHEEGVESFQLQILAQHIEKNIINKEITDKNNDGIQDVEISDLPSMTNLYEQFYENALKSLSFREKKLSQNLIEKGLIFASDNQRITIHEKIIFRDFKVNSDLIEKLINLRLVRSELSTTGGYNIELSHDAFVRPILSIAQKRKEKKNDRIVKFLSFGLALFIPLILFNTYFMYMPKSVKMQQPDFYIKTIDSLSNNLSKVNKLNDSLDLKVKKIETKFDSIETVETEIQRVEKIAMQYIDCLNEKNPFCISKLTADTMVRYYRIVSVFKKDREKFERQYFKKYPEEVITSIIDINTKKIDSLESYVVKATTNIKFRGITDTLMVIRLNLGNDFKVNSITSYFLKEEDKSSN